MLLKLWRPLSASLLKAALSIPTKCIRGRIIIITTNLVTRVKFVKCFTPGRFSNLSFLLKKMSRSRHFWQRIENRGWFTMFWTNCQSLYNYLLKYKLTLAVFGNPSLNFANSQKSWFFIFEKNYPSLKIFYANAIRDKSHVCLITTTSSRSLSALSWNTNK